ncbi:hypothetical protein X742_22460 [Mesorhizobium sp. LNHC232B00]|nr:hypothetical protein X742_22460 [Mesorhizobium sp. LNHC232B00]
MGVPFILADAMLEKLYRVDPIDWASAADLNERKAGGLYLGI